MTTLNAEQSRLIIRSQALENFLSKNEDVYQALVGFANRAGQLTKNNKALTALISEKDINGKGATKTKRELKAEIAETAGTICSFASDYAQNIGDNELHNAVNYTVNYVAHLRDAQMLGFVNRIVGVVTPLLSDPDFANYPVTAETLDTLSANAVDYNNYLGKAAMLDATSSIASQNINTVLKTVQGNINRLNSLVGYFKTINPNFVKGYKLATAVDHTGVRHNGIKGTIINSTTEEPIQGVTIILTGKTKTKTTTTDKAGAYEIDKFAAGKCTLTVSATGYETETLDVTILRGKTVKLNSSLSSQVIEFKTA